MVRKKVRDIEVLQVPTSRIDRERFRLIVCQPSRRTLYMGFSYDLTFFPEDWTRLWNIAG